MPSDPRERQRTFVCPCCSQWAQYAYEVNGRDVCGFCAGIGPDGRPTGKHGQHPGAPEAALPKEGED